MAIRMSGLASGLDTEAIVGALMSAQSLKKTKLSNAKTKLEWKQTKWQDLNKKLYKLYTEQISKLQLSSAYKTKKATVSDPTKANVTPGTSAANGSYTLEIESIAKSQYLTGGKISATKTSEKLVELKDRNGLPCVDLLNKELEVKVGNKTSWITITSDMTIADFTSKLNSAGLNASYDTTQQRFFISSKDSGVANAFSITTSSVSSDEMDARNALKSAVGYDKMNSANKAIVDSAMATLRTSGTNTDEYNKALDSIAKASFESKNKIAEDGATTYVKAKLYAGNYANFKTAAEATLKSDYYNDGGTIKDELLTEYKENYNTLTADDKAQLGANGASEDAYVAWRAQTAYEEAVEKKADSDTVSYVNEQMEKSTVKADIMAASYSGMTETEIRGGISATGAASDVISKAMVKYYGTGNDVDPITVEGFDGTSLYGSSQDTLKSQISTSVYNYASIDSTDRNGSSSGNELSGIGLANVTTTSDGTLSGGAYVMAASDSKIKLNGAELTSSGTTVSANGLSIELTGLTNGEAITFSVSTDVDAIYNTIKTALTEYNSVMKEMYDAYNADSAKGYEPLTSEQKEAMTDEDVKLWEDKIKNSLLRNDTNLSGVMQAMRSAMQSQIEYNGKNYSLASFGIMTSVNYLEGGQYHIYGDKDDSTYADMTDKLRKALEEDPDAVVNVLTGVFGKLRSAMSDKMSASKVSSTQTFYSDIKMKNDIKDYEEQIKEWEDKLADMEEAYYKKFTAMETALAKLQSQQSSLSGLFGN